MASASSYNTGVNKSTAYANVNRSTCTERTFKRKLDDVADLSNDDDSCTPRPNKRARTTKNGQRNSLMNNKKPRTSAGPKQGQSAAFNDAQPQKEAPPKAPRKDTPCEEEPRKATNSFGNENDAEAQLPFERLFECGTCHKSFKKVAELNDHKIKHERQPEDVSGSTDDGVKHKQQPRFPCRKCRQDFATLEERDHHVQTSTKHRLCRYCKQSAGEFRSAESLRHHYIEHHRGLYCHFCDRHFLNAFQYSSHMDGRHWPCSACGKMTHISQVYDCHCQPCYLAKFGTPFPEPQYQTNASTPDFYARLGVAPGSSHEQILKAAETRVKTHPDRRKRRDRLTQEEERAIEAEAKMVGHLLTFFRTRS